MTRNKLIKHRGLPPPMFFLISYICYYNDTRSTNSCVSERLFMMGNTYQYELIDAILRNTPDHRNVYNMDILKEMMNNEISEASDNHPIRDIIDIDNCTDKFVSKHKDIILMRYDQHQTLKSISQQCDLTTERIRQLLMKSIRKIDKYFNVRYKMLRYFGINRYERFKGYVSLIHGDIPYFDDAMFVYQIDGFDKRVSDITKHEIEKENIYFERTLTTYSNFVNISKVGLDQYIEQLEEENTSLNIKYTHVDSDTLKITRELTFNDLNLSTRAYNVIRRSCKTVEQLCMMSESQILDIRGCGLFTLNEIKNALKKKGLCLKEEQK